MSTPMTAAQFVAQLKKWGIPFVEHNGPGWKEYGHGWETHNRGDRGNGFNGVHGIVQHHTGDDIQSVSTLWSGRSGLPGPLCHVGNDSSGVLHLVGHGRTNHAGGGDPAVLQKVISESYSGVLSSRYHEGAPGAYDGNGVFYGIENIYAGTHGMTPTQYNTAILFSCAVSDFHKWGAKSTIGHGEWSNQKWDPGYKSNTMMDMSRFRDDIATRLRSGPPNLIRTYKVVQGDTLWRIAEQMLGNGSRAHEIAVLNHLPNQDEITPGQLLKIPAK